MIRASETYLGDGLYASHDGFMIWLRAPIGGGRDHNVALEPPVFEAFLRFAAKHWCADAMIKILKDELAARGDE
jgi:hypothetical protein